VKSAEQLAVLFETLDILAATFKGFDPPAILARAHALEEAGALQPVDVPGERGRRDAFLRSELGKGKPGAPLDQPEERRLACGDADLLRLLSQLACEAEENGAELVGGELWTKRNLTNH